MQPTDHRRPARPRIVAVAFWLYLVGIVGMFAQLLDMPGYLGWEHALIDRMLDLMDTPDFARPNPEDTTVQVVVTTVVSLVFTAAFWAMIAAFVRRGASWARVVATVFTAIGVVIGPLALVVGSLLAPPPAAYLLLLLPGFAGLYAATVLLWTRPARSYFSAVQAHDRARTVNRWQGTPAGPAA